MKTGKKMNPRKKTKRDTEWHRVCSAITTDSVRVSVPRAFLSTLTLFFHHVSDTMAGDNRPDHGLVMMRESHHRKVLRLLHRYYELSKKQKGL